MDDVLLKTSLQATYTHCMLYGQQPLPQLHTSCCQARSQLSSTSSHSTQQLLCATCSPAALRRTLASRPAPAAVTVYCQCPVLLLSLHCSAAYLDEGTGQQETVCQTDLHTAQQRGHTSAVCWQVAEVVHHLWVGGHWGLQEAHKGVTVHRLDGLGLQSYKQRHIYACYYHVEATPAVQELSHAPTTRSQIHRALLQ